MKMMFRVGLVWLLLVCGSLQSWALEPCSRGSKQGDWCEIAINVLRPTQAGVGQLQVDSNAQKWAMFDDNEIDNLMKKKEIPVVIGPDGQFWLVDRHHLTKALWQLGVTQVRVKVMGVLTDPAQFWPQMIARRWAWLFDQQGRAIAPKQLPARIDLLTDYPYRSLAGALEDEGYISKKEQVYFIEFAWAQWLGEQMQWASIDHHNFAKRLAQAKALACQSEARHLPGFFGKACKA